MVLSLRDSMVEINGNQSMESTDKQLVEPNDFLYELRSYKMKNRRLLTATAIQNLELEYNEFVMNYFVYHQQSNTVAEYENSFLQLKRWAETWNEEKFDENWVVSIFIKRLQEEIQEYVKLWSPNSLQRAIILAKWQELCLVDKVFDKSPKPTEAKANSEIEKEFVYCEEIEREPNMKVNSIDPFSLISSCHVSVFAPFIFTSLINDCGYQAFDKIPGRDKNSQISKLKENGLYWGERGKSENTLFYLYVGHFLKTYMMNSYYWEVFVDCAFFYSGEVKKLWDLIDDKFAIVREQTTQLKIEEDNMGDGKEFIEKVFSILLDRSSNPDILNSHKQTQLMLAAMSENISCIEKLIQARENILIFDSLHGRICIHYAAYYGHSDCLQAILSAAHSSPVAHYWGFARFVNIRDGSGATPLLLVARQSSLECVRILLRNGALASAYTCGYSSTCSYSWSTTLHLAASGGSLVSVQELLVWGANRVQQDSTGKTTYIVALKHKHTTSAQKIFVVEQVIGRGHVLNYLSIPTMCFSHSEISLVVAKTSFKTNTKALAENEWEGITKLIYIPYYGEILGVHIFVLYDVNLIHESSNAIALGTSIQRDMIYFHLFRGMTTFSNFSPFVYTTNFETIHQNNALKVKFYYWVFFLKLRGINYIMSEFAKKRFDRYIICSLHQNHDHIVVVIKKLDCYIVVGMPTTTAYKIKWKLVKVLFSWYLHCSKYQWMLHENFNPNLDVKKLRIVLLLEKFNLQFIHVETPPIHDGIIVCSPIKYYKMTDLAKQLNMAELMELDDIVVELGKTFELRSQSNAHNHRGAKGVWTITLHVFFKKLNPVLSRLLDELHKWKFCYVNYGLVIAATTWDMNKIYFSDETDYEILDNYLRVIQSREFFIAWQFVEGTEVLFRSSKEWEGASGFIFHVIWLIFFDITLVVYYHCGWTLHYGRFFLNWCSKVLVDHGDRVLALANLAFEGTSISTKLLDIHWWYKVASYAAELTAGFYNLCNRDSYDRITSMFKKHGVAMNFTGVELHTLDQHEDFSEVLADTERVVWPLFTSNLCSHLEDKVDFEGMVLLRIYSVINIY